MSSVANARIEHPAGCTAQIEASALEDLQPQTMSVLQLRKTLRAIGGPTVGLQSTLAARLQQAIDDGTVAALAAKLHANEITPSQPCIVDVNKTQAEARARLQKETALKAKGAREELVAAAAAQRARISLSRSLSPRVSSDAFGLANAGSGGTSSQETAAVSEVVANGSASQSSSKVVEVVDTKGPQRPAALPLRNLPAKAASEKSLSKSLSPANRKPVSPFGALTSAATAKMRALLPQDSSSHQNTAANTPPLPPARPAVPPKDTQQQSSPLCPPSPPTFSSDALERKKKEIQARYPDMRKGQGSGGSGTLTAVAAAAALPSTPTPPYTNNTTASASTTTSNISSAPTSAKSVPLKKVESSVSDSTHAGADQDRESYDTYQVDADTGPVHAEEGGDFSSDSSDGEDEAEKAVEEQQRLEALRQKEEAAAAHQTANAAKTPTNVPVQEEEEEAAPDKSGIPNWARGGQLAAALEKQFGGANPINPDTIFSEFFTCDLQRIFDTKKKRYTSRTSSGNWLNDRLTMPERLAYQKAMGYQAPQELPRGGTATAVDS